MAKTRTLKEDDDEKTVKENIQKRFKNMFSGSGEPLSNMSLQEVESLKARIAKLEKELVKQLKDIRPRMIKAGYKPGEMYINTIDKGIKNKNITIQQKNNIIWLMSKIEEWNI